MNCPHCGSAATTRLTSRTSLGYPTFRCSACSRRFNERTDTPYNFLEFPTDVVLLVVLWRLRYKLSLRDLRDLSEMFLVRGFEFTHEAVRDWERRFTPLITEQLRLRRRGKAGRSWYVDETYVRVSGKWRYLYRGIDTHGNLVDSMLSEHRDMVSAKKFFAQAKEVVGHKPVRVEASEMRSGVGGDCDNRVSLPKPDHLPARNTDELPSLLVLNNHLSSQENFFRLQSFPL